MRTLFKHPKIFLFLALLVLPCGFAHARPAAKVFFQGERLVFLNGTDIGALKDQTLENVKVVIAEDGSIFIEAPQYKVVKEQKYHPLLPEELPRFPKEETGKTQPLDGTYSKETGKKKETAESGDP